MIKSMVRPVLRFFGIRRLLIYNTLLTAAYIFACGLFRANTPYVLILLTLWIAGLSRSVEYTAIQSLAYADLPPALTARDAGDDHQKQTGRGFGHRGDVNRPRDAAGFERSGDAACGGG